MNRSPLLAGAVALLAALLLAAPAAAMDPRVCAFKGDWARVFQVGQNDRLDDRFAARVNNKAVARVVARVTNTHTIPPSCRLASWEAVEGCFNPSKEGSTAYPTRGQYGLRFFLDFACSPGSTPGANAGAATDAATLHYQVWAWPNVLPSGAITSMDMDYKLFPTSA